MLIYSCIALETGGLAAYQQESATFASFPHDIAILPDRVHYLALGAAGEGGELGDLNKKVLRNDGGVILPAMRAGQVLEAGDLLWYLARLADRIGEDLEALAARAAKGRSELPSQPERRLAYVTLRLDGAIGSLSGTIAGTLLEDDPGQEVEYERLSIRNELEEALLWWLRCLELCHLTVAEVVAANNAKLADRRARGVINAAGNYR